MRCGVFLAPTKTKGSFTAFSSISTEEGWQKQTTASVFRAVQQATNDRQKRLVTAWCCFSQCWVVTWNVVLKSLCTWAVGVMNEVWHFSSSNKNPRKFHGVQFNVHWRRLTKANHCSRISSCSASNQRPTKKAGSGMVLFLSVLGCDMERGAQISVYMGRGCHEWGVAFCLAPTKTKGSFTAFSSMSTEEGWQKQTTASVFRAVQQATNDRQKRLVTAWCCFSQC